MDFLPPAFEALNRYSQFVIYKLIPKINSVKKDKIPIDYRTGLPPYKIIPEIWTTAEKAISAAKKFGKEYGVGFYFTQNDPFWFLDIDNCLDPVNKTITPIANKILKKLSGAAVEISSSGTGLHIIGSGVVPLHTCRNKTHNLEFYTEKRFVALTGDQCSGSANFDAAHLLTDIIQIYFTKKINQSTQLNEWTTFPCDEWRGTENDEELIGRMLRSKSATSIFNNKASFRDLWENNELVLAQQFTSVNSEDPYNRSSVDRALAQHLTFWTGNNCERIKNLMLRSALVREKWNREDYLRRTILSACSQATKWLCDPEPHKTPSSSIVPPGNFLNIEAQKQLFEGCVYVCDDHRVFIPGGLMLNSDRFKVWYGGYTFITTPDNSRTTRNAWEAFTENQAIKFERATSSCFKPDKTPGGIININGEKYVNSYWPIEIPRISGDPQRFITHLSKLIPDEKDQHIFLCYLAACVQYKGIKFQWCPLIQGVEGNGKTLFTKCVAFAIGRKYSHFLNPKEIDAKHNDWLYGKILIGVEDIYAKDLKFEVMEILKPMITGSQQDIEPKYQARTTRDICSNFIINTNHKDGLRKYRNDRRIAPFYTAQQTYADLKRDGMLGDYFHDLYSWLDNEKGYEIIAEFLHSYPLPSTFIKTLRDRAPDTSSTESAIEHGRSNIEQEILEAIEQGVQGFRTGWVSSMALDRLLLSVRADQKIPLNKRRELMQSLDYDWHPRLKDGRVNMIVMPDGGKPRLYVHKNNKSGLLLDSASQIAKAYSDAQK